MDYITVNYGRSGSFDATVKGLEGLTIKNLLALTAIRLQARHGFTVYEGDYFKLGGRKLQDEEKIEKF